MSVTPSRIIHVAVPAKFILTIIFIINFTVVFAQKTNEPKPGEAYTQAIKDGDRLLQAGDYIHALNEFENALKLSPSQKYPQDKIAEIEKTLADSQLSNTLFETAITNGEKYFVAKAYKNAKREYLNALRLDPEAQYPKDRLIEISKIFTDPEDEAQFSSAIKSADLAFGKASYDEAIGFYNQALAIKPGDKTVKTRIADADRLKVELAAKKDTYNNLITTADKLLEQKKYAEARSEYAKALAILPGENYPGGKIASIDQLFAATKAGDDAYTAIIDEADKLYVARDFDNARIRYQQALVMRPGERYPKSMLEKADMGQTEVRTIRQRYDDAIINADNLFKAAEMDAALIGYQSASAIIPSETYPKTKITEINKIVSDRNSRQDAYRIAIANGDQAFDAATYPRALTEYKNALSLQPGEDYPKTRIAAIEALLLKEKDLQESYSKAVATADKEFAAKRFPEAITGYQSALAMKPAEKYPQDKITEINGMLDKLKSVQETYDKAITDADKAFGEKNYSIALAGYQSALGLKPSETYPKGKIAEINTLLARQKTLQDNYDKAIAVAGKAFGEKNYPAALAGYQSALGFKPSETFPQEKIAEINGILAQQQSLQENYNIAIVAADKDLAAKKYPEALSGYQAALVLKPAEKYPQGKIDEINGLLGKQKTTQENYDRTIASADKALVDKKYGEALAAYKSALVIIPSETYPQGKISEINDILNGLKVIDNNYNAAIAGADKDLAVKKYPEAIAGYQAALVLKPAEKYPQDKVAEINKILDNQRSVQENYDKAIAEADKAFGEKNYSLALGGFQSALAIKPSESYPKGKVNEINTILGQQKALKDSFDKAIASADKDFSAMKYPEAITGYQSALVLIPGETYPQDKITEINGILAGQKASQEKYDLAIIDADKAFAEKNYTTALTGYQAALGIKPGEKYPQGKITEINGMLGQQKALQDRYDKAIASADKSLAAKDYPLALTGYQTALGIIPGEKYPQEKITEINVILTQQKTLQDSYDKAMAAADKDFEAKKYAEALSGYQSALGLKPSESYPQEKITAINGIFNQQKALQENYDKAIASADKAFGDKNYTEALSGYQSALGLKPAETYPQGKINDINTILGKQKTIQDSYDKAIASADKAFEEKKYTAASTGYQDALGIKPNEVYPKEKIASIVALLAQQKDLEDNYSKTIAAADKALLLKDYSPALSGYQAAVALKPGEAYPQGKITEINTILGKQKSLDDSYNKAIADADKLLGDKNYTLATAGYKSALLIKPEEAYPQDKIAEINALVVKQKALNESYTKAVADADKAYADKDYSLAINGYQAALGLKPDETYPKEKITAINAIFAEDKEKTDQRFTELICKADADYAKQNYTDARTSYQQASSLKPGEAYPKDKLTEITILLLARTKEMKDAYDKIIVDADKAYAARIYDQAIDFYTSAHTAKPDEAYPGEMIAKIQKYMSEHSMVNVTKETFLVLKDTEKKFSFKPVDAGLRKNNYVVIKARNPGSSKPKVYLNYGRDNAKNGGIVLRSITSDVNNDFIIRISVQDKWYREDNNWLSLYSEGGEIEVSSIQIAQGD